MILVCFFPSLATVACTFRSTQRAVTTFGGCFTLQSPVLHPIRRSRWRSTSSITSQKRQSEHRRLARMGASFKSSIGEIRIIMRPLTRSMHHHQSQTHRSTDQAERHHAWAFVAGRLLPCAAQFFSASILFRADRRHKSGVSFGGRGRDVHCTRTSEVNLVGDRQHVRSQVQACC